MNNQTLQNRFRGESVLSLPTLAATRRVNRVVLAATVLLSAGLNQAFADPGFVGFYNEDTGDSAATFLGRTYSPFTAGVQPLSRGWTHILHLGGNWLLYYNQDSGLGATAYADPYTGNMTPADVFRFSAGWSSIVLHNGYLLFYNKAAGIGVVGEMQYTASHYVFRQFPTIYNLATGWTHISGGGSSLLFYNAETGAGVTGGWVYTYPNFCIGVCAPSDVKFQQKVVYPVRSFDRNCTDLIRSVSGLIFYRADDGFSVIVDISAKGQVTPRAYSFAYLSPGWTGFASVDDSILFYNKNTGYAAVGHIVESFENVGQMPGTLITDQEFPGLFPTGWTSVFGFDRVVH